MSSSVVSDLFLNKESSKFSSKERSSTKNHSLGQVWDLKIGWGLSDPSCLLTILGIRLGFSNTGGGFGSGLALVYLLEANVVKFLLYNIYFSVSNSEHHFPEPRNLQAKYYWGDLSLCSDTRNILWLWIFRISACNYIPLQKRFNNVRLAIIFQNSQTNLLKVHVI